MEANAFVGSLAADEILDLEDGHWYKTITETMNVPMSATRRIDFLHSTSDEICEPSPWVSALRCKHDLERNPNGMLGMWTTISTDVPYRYGSRVYQGTVELLTDHRLGTVDIEELMTLSNQANQLETRAEQFEFYKRINEEWRSRMWRAVVVKEPKVSIMIVLNAHVITNWRELLDLPVLNNAEFLAGISAGTIPIDYAALAEKPKATKR